MHRADASHCSARALQHGDLDPLITDAVSIDAVDPRRRQTTRRHKLTDTSSVDISNLIFTFTYRRYDVGAVRRHTCPQESKLRGVEGAMLHVGGESG